MRRKPWYPEKRSPGSRDRRFWDLGAILDKDNCLTFLRMACGASKAGNRGFRVHILDKVKNPDGIDIVQEGSGYAITFRDAETDATIGHIDKNGTVTPASSETKKENFKAIRDQSAAKWIENLDSRSWNYLTNPEERFVGPTAENFKEVTGYGDGKGINMLTLLGMVLRMVQYVWSEHKKVKEKIALMESESEKKV